MDNGTFYFCMDVFVGTSGVSLLVFAARGLARGRIDGVSLGSRKGTVPYDRGSSPVGWFGSILFYTLVGALMIFGAAVSADKVPPHDWLATPAWVAPLLAVVIAIEYRKRRLGLAVGGVGVAVGLASAVWTGSIGLLGSAASAAGTLIAYLATRASSGQVSPPS